MSDLTLPGPAPKRIELSPEDRARIAVVIAEFDRYWADEARYWDIARWIFLQERNARRARRIVARRKARRS